jgi:hypothetical protein
MTEIVYNVITKQTQTRRLIMKSYTHFTLFERNSLQQFLNEWKSFQRRITMYCSFNQCSSKKMPWFSIAT